MLLHVYTVYVYWKLMHVWGWCDTISIHAHMYTGSSAISDTILPPLTKHTFNHLFYKIWVFNQLNLKTGWYINVLEQKNYSYLSSKLGDELVLGALAHGGPHADGGHGEGQPHAQLLCLLDEISSKDSSLIRTIQIFDTF